jgi:hypothetical protein
MYIWKIDQLNKELITGELPEREKFKYLVASSIIYGLAMIQYSSPNQADTWSGVIAAIVTVIGLFFIYKCNGGDNGKEFLTRYLSISLVILVRLLVLLMLPSLIVLMVVQEIYLGGMPDETTTIDLAYIIIIEVVYVFWVAKHINKVARGSNT